MLRYALSVCGLMVLAVGGGAQTPAKPTPINGPGSTLSQTPRADVPHSPPLPYGLQLMSRFDLLPTLRNTKCVQDSSYDRSGGNGDSGTFFRKEGNKAILSDIRGPGCIYRFWSANAAGHLKIFFDGEETPRIDCQMQDYFLGKVAPFITPLVGHKSGGWYSFFPMPFQKSCRIEVTDPGNMYYHVEYQLYPDGTPVTTYSNTLSSDDQQALTKIVAQWNHLGDDPKEPVTPKKEIHGKFELKAGQKRDFSNIRGAGEVTALRIKIVPADRLSLRQTVLRVYWDNAKEPGIEAPVGDFFGIGFGDQRYQSLPAAMTDSGYVCYWPMPFGKRARFELTNQGAEPIKEVTWSVDYTRLKKRLEDVGYFHAQWHRQTTVAGEHFHILQTSGRGHYVGEHTDMQGDRGIGFLEGDEKFYVDGETFPSIHGTGTEDFYTGGWYFDEGPFHLAYHGCTVKSDAFSRVAAYRYQIQDCVPFQHDLKVDIEHGGANDYPGADYSCVAYWYQDSPTHHWSPIDTAQLTPAHIKMSNAQEAEALTWTSGKHDVMDDLTLAAEASGGKVVAVTSDSPAEFKFHVGAEDVYRLLFSEIAMPDSPDEVKVSLDGTALTGLGQFGDPKKAKEGRAESGTLVALTPGDHTVRLSVPTGKTLYFDYLRTEPSKKERGVIEGESLTERADTGGQNTVSTVTLDEAFSGDRALKWSPKTPDAYVKLPITVPVDALYTLELGVGRLPNSARIAAQIDNGDVLPAVDTADKEKTGRKNVRLGDNLHLSPGAHTLVLTYKGGDPSISEHMLLLDYIKLLKYRYTHSVEAESLKVLDHKGGDAQTQDMAGFGNGWSGDSQFWFVCHEKGGEATLELPVQPAGKYTLAVYFTTAKDYGIVQTLVDGMPVGSPTDCFTTDVRAKGRTELGTVDLTAGPHRITFRAIDKNKSSSSYLIGVDAIGLEPVK